MRIGALCSSILALALAGCGILLPGESNTDNHLDRELAALVPVPPKDTAAAFLDSAEVAFKVDRKNVFEYTCVADHSMGGLGPNYVGLGMKVETRPVGDSVEIVSSHFWSDSQPHRLPMPPRFYRKGSDSVITYGTKDAPLTVYPTLPNAPNGVFLLNDGRKLMLMGGDSLSRSLRVYLEPYGLIYGYINQGSMDADMLEFELQRWNGEVVPRDSLLAQVKGLAQAYLLHHAFDTRYRWSRFSR